MNEWCSSITCLSHCDPITGRVGLLLGSYEPASHTPSTFLSYLFYLGVGEVEVGGGGGALYLDDNKLHLHLKHIL